MPAARRAPRGADQLRSLALGLADVPEPAPEPEPEPEPDAPQLVTAPDPEPAPAAPAARTRRPGPMPAEQRPAPRYGGRGASINLSVTADMKRALALAQIDDGIETTARIRALIQLWQEDARLQARVAKLADVLKGRNAWRG